MDQFIVSAAGSDFGYLQCYDLTAWNSGFGAHPQGTRGIDLFIGEPDMIERGHGSAFIRRFVDGRLESGAPRIVTDPDPANARAVRAYEKAGFERAAYGRYARWPGSVDGPQRMTVTSGHRQSSGRQRAFGLALVVDRALPCSRCRPRSCSRWAGCRSAPAAMSSSGTAWCRARKIRSTSPTGTRCRMSCTASCSTARPSWCFRASPGRAA